MTLPGKTVGRGRANLSGMTIRADICTSVPAGREHGGQRHGLRRGGELVAGRYRVLRLLGRGGMGTVWLAVDCHLCRPVAIKETTLSWTGSAEDDQLLREAQAACAVSHPGVVQVHDLAADGDHQWIVMEALAGRSLAATVQEQGPLSVANTVELGLRLLEALQALHDCGVVHGDIKPSNVHLVAPGRPVLTDFGLATSTGRPVRVDVGPFVGTPAHTAPEVFRTGTRTPASDLFALGSTLFYAVEGRPAFQAPDPVATALAVLSDSRATVRHGEPIQRVIDGLLAHDPTRRTTARDAHSWLQEIESELAWSACSVAPASY